MPSFSIEAVPEAVPLSADTLLDILRRAASSNQLQVQTAAQQLQNWEKQPGFYSGLQTIFIEHSQPLEVRLLAIITIKNGIDKYWRRTAQNAISREEKDLISSRCMPAGLQEPNARLGLQNAVIFAKITRHEFPTFWPSAIETLTQTLRGAADDTLPRILLIILYVIKELSTAKLQRSRASLYGAAPDLFRALGDVYVRVVGRWIESGDVHAAETSLLALRVLRRLIIAGYQRPADANEVQEFWKVIRSQFAQFYGLIGTAPDNLRPLVEKHLVQISKLHLNMIREHPTAFPQLDDAIGIAQSYWGLLLEFGKTFGIQALSAAELGTDGDVDDEPLCLEKLSLNALLLLRACVKMVYNPAQTFRYVRQEEKEERKQSRETMKQALLSEALVREMMETLVVKFFVFRPRDLHEWETEPDEWERTQEGEGESWEHSVRICAEKLFLDLVLNNKDLLIPPLLHVFNAARESEDVLVKDSVYAAIGLAAPVLESLVDFDEFLRNTLVSEVQVQRSGAHLLRRRIAIVIGQWVVVKPIDRSLVYQIFQHLLDTNDSHNDLVVRVTAGRHFKSVMDPWDIRMADFTPYAASILERLIHLTREVSLPETKLALLNSLRTTFIRMEHHATPFADQILSALPPLWDQAEDAFLMKQTILGILSSLMTAIGTESRRYHNLILPLISRSLDPAEEARTFLMEDALDLWASILEQTTQLTPELVALAQLLEPIFESASDNFIKALEIEELYVVLDPMGWLERGDRLHVYAALLQEKIRDVARDLVHKILQILAQAATAQLEAFAQGLHASGLLRAMLEGLHSVYEANQTTGPKRRTPKIDMFSQTAYYSVFARILHANPRLGMEMVQSHDSDALEWFVTEWYAHFDNLPHADHKKLHCLGLTALLQVPAAMPLMLQHLQQLLNMWTDVLFECCESREDGSLGKDDLVWGRQEPASDPDAPPPVPDEQRRRDVSTPPSSDLANEQILYNDPVHTVPINEYVRDAVQRLVEACGGQGPFQAEWLVNVDSNVVQAFAQMQLN